TAIGCGFGLAQCVYRDDVLESAAWIAGSGPSRRRPVRFAHDVIRIEIAGSRGDPIDPFGRLVMAAVRVRRELSHTGGTISVVGGLVVVGADGAVVVVFNGFE